MTFRRRLFVATLIVGAGICCFQPIMRSRMEASLSEFLGSKVEIGSSKISFRDGTIALSEIVIKPTDTDATREDEKPLKAIHIGHAALKFNWNGVLYRNLKADSFLASDVDWEMVSPTHQSIPIAIENTADSLLEPEDTSKALDAGVDSLIQPIKFRLTEESALQNRAQQKISLQLKSIADRLVELAPTDGSLNVLRQRFVVEDAAKQVLEVKQWIAENRTSRKEADKTINTFVQTAQKQIVAKVKGDPELESKRIQDAAKQIATQAIAKEWNQSRPILQAAMASLTSLQKHEDMKFSDSEVRTPLASSAILSQIPVGMSHCSSGRISGNLQLPSFPAESRSSGFEMQFWNLSSRYCLDASKPTVALKLTREPKQEASPWLVCIAQQVAIPQSDATQIQFTFEKKHENLGTSAAKIQHANRGWSASMSIPTQACLNLPSLKAIATEGKGLNERGHVVGKLIGKTPSIGIHQDDLLIEIEPQSLIALETTLASWHKATSEWKRVQAGIRGTEQLNNELLAVNTRWKQLGDEHSRAHDGWKSRIAELDDQIQKLGSSFQRTSRATSVPNR